MARPPLSQPAADHLLRRDQQLLDCFQKALGHELPNQLIALQGLLRILELEQADRLDSAGRDLLARVAAAARRCHDLVNALAAVGRTARATDPVEQRSFTDVAREAIAEAKGLYPGRPVEYHLCHSGGDPVVPYPAVRVALAALLRSLVQLAPAGRPLRIEVGARTTAAGREIWLLGDHGPSPEPAALRFEPFPPGATADGNLGPFLARLLVEGCGGALHAEPHPTGGARIILTLPASDTEGNP